MQRAARSCAEGPLRRRQAVSTWDELEPGAWIWPDRRGTGDLPRHVGGARSPPGEDRRPPDALWRQPPRGQPPASNTSAGRVSTPATSGLSSSGRRPASSWSDSPPRARRTCSRGHSSFTGTGPTLDALTSPRSSSSRARPDVGWRARWPLAQRSLRGPTRALTSRAQPGTDLLRRLDGAEGMRGDRRQSTRRGHPAASRARRPRASLVGATTSVADLDRRRGGCGRGDRRSPAGDLQQSGLSDRRPVQSGMRSRRQPRGPALRSHAARARRLARRAATTRRGRRDLG